MKYKLCAPIDEDNLYGNDGIMKTMMKTIPDWKIKKDQTEINSTYGGCIIEYLLVCTKCKEQTGYNYPFFALQNEWEHILITEHNVVTILEIVYDRIYFRYYY